MLGMGNLSVPKTYISKKEIKLSVVFLATLQKRFLIRINLENPNTTPEAELLPRVHGSFHCEGTLGLPSSADGSRHKSLRSSSPTVPDPCTLLSA